MHHLPLYCTASHLNMNLSSLAVLTFLALILAGGGGGAELLLDQVAEESRDQAQAEDQKYADRDKLYSPYSLSLLPPIAHHHSPLHRAHRKPHQSPRYSQSGLFSLSPGETLNWLSVVPMLHTNGKPGTYRLGQFQNGQYYLKPVKPPRQNNLMGLNSTETPVLHVRPKRRTAKRKLVLKKVYSSGFRNHGSNSYESIILPDLAAAESHQIHYKTKIKHHHHHHHHQYVKTIVKKVPVEVPIKVYVDKPYPVEKKVPYPVEKVVEHVIEKKVPVIVEKKVPYPVEKVVHKLIEKKVPYAVERVVHKVVEKKVPVVVEKKIPYPVKVFHPYPIVEKQIVHKPHTVIKHVPVYKEVKVHVKQPVPYPVEKKVPFPVEIKVPYIVEKNVPFPIEVEKKVPFPVKVYVPQPFTVEKKVPYPIEVKVKEPFPVIKHVPVPVYIEKPIDAKRDEAIPVPVYAQSYGNFNIFGNNNPHKQSHSKS